MEIFYWPTLRNVKSTLYIYIQLKKKQLMLIFENLKKTFSIFWYVMQCVIKTTKSPTITISVYRVEIPNSLCFSTWELRSLPKQWTHGPTLLLWRSHLHTALRLFKNLS